MPAWLIVLMVLVVALLVWRSVARRRRADELTLRESEWGDGTRNVGERWRTGGY
jgi:ABC-type dipeptide/oligopeptide/nickel transport system permease subunit